MNLQCSTFVLLSSRIDARFAIGRMRFRELTVATDFRFVSFNLLILLSLRLDASQLGSARLDRGPAWASFVCVDCAANVWPSFRSIASGQGL